MTGFGPSPWYSPVPVAKKVPSKEFVRLKSAAPVSTSSKPVLACACTTVRSFAFSTSTFAIAWPAELEHAPAGVVTMPMVCACAPNASDEKSKPLNMHTSSRVIVAAVPAVVASLAVLLTAGAIALSADLFRHAGLSLYTEQYLSALLAIATPLVFLHVRANGERGGRAPWYDVLAAAAAAIAGGYLAVRFPPLSELVSRQPWDGLVCAGALLVFFLEGLRRTSGMALFWTTLAFIALALFGGSLPGEFAARSIPPARLAYYLVWDSSAVLGVAMKIIATVVVVYVFFGQVLFKAGGSQFFTGLAMALMGRYRGGPAKIAIVGSSLFGSISGNIVSNVMTVGTVTIPLMKRAGFRPHLAAAIEACASTGGQITPPVMGIAAFIMAEFLQVPFFEVALAAVVTALLFYVALFIQVDLEAARSKILPMPREEIPRLRPARR